MKAVISVQRRDAWIDEAIANFDFETEEEYKAKVTKLRELLESVDLG